MSAVLYVRIGEVIGTHVQGGVKVAYHEHLQIQQHIDPPVVRTFATKVQFCSKLSFSQAPEVLDFWPLNDYG